MLIEDSAQRQRVESKGWLKKKSGEWTDQCEQSEKIFVWIIQYLEYTQVA